jgi:hypothetical protein
MSTEILDASGPATRVLPGAARRRSPSSASTTGRRPLRTDEARASAVAIANRPDEGCERTYAPEGVCAGRLARFDPERSLTSAASPRSPARDQRRERADFETESASRTTHSRTAFMARSWRVHPVVRASTALVTPPLTSLFVHDRRNRELPKLRTRVRFPSPALYECAGQSESERVACDRERRSERFHRAFIARTYESANTGSTSTARRT